jgi:hypothetical protein
VEKKKKQGRHPSEKTTEAMKIEMLVKRAEVKCSC